MPIETLDAENQVCDSNMSSEKLNGAELLAVLISVKKGDFSVRMPVAKTGLAGKIADVLNEIIDLNQRLTSECDRIGRVVGKEGRINERAHLEEATGGWRDSIVSINSLVTDLAHPTQEMARVIGAVARGDLTQTMTTEIEGRPLKGEFLRISTIVNTMVDQLSSFASEVTRVAREVGTEGKLGGQAQVKGVAGIWKDLTDNVNQLAANLTSQVRAIAEVATAVTKGNLTRFISVEAQGEVAALKDNLNEMIRNLKETTQKNTEQDWLKTHLARFTRMLQGQRNMLNVSKLILSELSSLVNIQYGAFYVVENEGKNAGLRLLGGYAHDGAHMPREWLTLGDGLVGQCAVERRRLILNDIPSSFIRISSGLGSTPARNVVILPVLFEGQIKAVIELASLERLSEIHLGFLDQLMESIGIVLNTIAANMRTEDLLKKSQSLTQSLQKQQTELTETNEKLGEKARLLEDQKAEIERKNQEVELAKKALEEKAEQLALASKYKSQFLANMSHELRTPLNSLLILSKNLAENQEGNLNGKQVEFAKTVYSSGSDLLALINEILDMSKIESGTITVEIGEVRMSEVTESVERGFRQIAQDRGLDFEINVDPAVPNSLATDAKRLQQVLKNLLSNACKFTEKGSVDLRIFLADPETRFDNVVLQTAEKVIGFAVKDSGIGVAPEKQKIIFEAFQQADMTTSWKYGGTGLGLTISREIANLLGGEIWVESQP
ncbi:MAG: GAF domain-containing protein, partial [Elusimicrobia bacterium]|nr:GAF domain-containing protein [Elusimicrobiota bacterium]